MVYENKIIVTVRDFVIAFFVVLFFFFEGIIDTINVLLNFALPYKRILVIGFFSCVLLVFYPVKIRRVYYLFFVVSLLCGFSFIANDKSFSDLYTFSSQIFIALFSYLIVQLAISEDNFVWIGKILQVCSVIQLPIIVLQYFLYSNLPEKLTGYVAYLDIGSGSFYLKGDPALSFFLVCWITFLLFDRNAYKITKYRTSTVLWLTVTCFITNSKIMQVAIIIVFLLYLLKNLSLKKLVTYGVIGLIFFVSLEVTLPYFGFDDLSIIHRFKKVLYEVHNIDKGSNEKLFLSGEFSRPAAIFYLTVVEPLSLLGKGPGTAIELTPSPLGHIFTYYIDLGLLALVITYLILISIVEKYDANSILYFITLVLLSYTTDIFNIVPIFFIYSYLNRVKTFH